MCHVIRWGVQVVIQSCVDPLFWLGGSCRNVFLELDIESVLQTQ